MSGEVQSISGARVVAQSGTVTITFPSGESLAELMKALSDEGSNFTESVFTSTRSATSAAIGGATVTERVLARAGARVGEAALEGGKATLSTTSKVLSGTAGGIGVVFGAVDIGFGIHNLVKGSAKKIHVDDALRAVSLGLTASKVPLSKRQIYALAKAEQDLQVLSKDITIHHEAVNGSKIGGGVVSVIGGGLTIASVFFPPLLLAGAIVGGIGGATSVTASIVDLCASHKKRLHTIFAELVKVALVPFAE